MRSPVMMLVEPRNPAAATRDQLVQFVVAYVSLLAACREARGQGRPPEEGPLDHRRLHEQGVGAATLQWMLYQAHVEHFEREAGSNGTARWGRKPSAVVGERSAFALTALGEAFGNWLVESVWPPGGTGGDPGFAWAHESRLNGDTGLRPSHSPGSALPHDGIDLNRVSGVIRVGLLVPRYDAAERLLTWGRHVLKSYRQPSGNQETILMAAEEMAWARWFDDPLPRVRTGNPKVRLHDAIKKLNRHQEVPLVHFKGDGTGTRVGWELR